MGTKPSSARPMFVVGAMMLVTCLCCGALAREDAKIAKREAAHAAEAAAAQAAAENAEHERLVEGSSDAATHVDDLLQRCDPLLVARDAAGADVLLKEARGLVDRYEHGHVGLEWTQPVTAKLAPREAHRTALLDLETGRGHVKDKAWESADAIFEKGQARIASIPADYEQAKAAAAVGRDLASARQRIAKQVAKAKREAKQEADEAAAIAAVCGPAPALDPWDGGIISVASALRQSAHDPGSIDVERCTVPVLTKSCWRTTCIVRGKNAFGAKVAEQRTFLIGVGMVSEAD